MGRGAWEEAHSAFERALQTDESPEVLFGLGEAQWWLGEIRGSVRCWEQAYAAFYRRPDPAQAVNAAIQLCFIYQANLGNHAAAAGWAARAGRLVDEFDLEPLRGWVLLIKACGCSDPEQSETWARQARRMAVEVGDRDFELCALSEIGGALIGQGRIGEGGRRSPGSRDREVRAARCWRRRAASGSSWRPARSRASPAGRNETCPSHRRRLGLHVRAEPWSKRKATG